MGKHLGMALLVAIAAAGCASQQQVEPHIWIQSAGLTFVWANGTPRSCYTEPWHPTCELYRTLMFQ
jgi:hypothetical protein